MSNHLVYKVYNTATGKFWHNNSSRMHEGFVFQSKSAASARLKRMYWANTKGNGWIVVEYQLTATPRPTTIEKGK